MQPQKIRLNEIERIAIRRLYQNLVENIESELRARLLARADLPDVPEFRASLGAAHVAIAWPAFVRTGFPEDPELADILVHRAQSYGVMRNLRQNVVMAENSRLEVLTDHGDRDIARDAMRLLIAESRFNDRFDDPRLGRGDLSEAADHRLVWTVAAALRDYGRQQHGLDGWSLDESIIGVATAMLAEQDDSAPADGIAMALAARLDRAGLLDDALLVEALNSARLTLYVAILAVRSGTDFDTAWEMAAMPDAPSHMVLLKSISMERTAASHLLVAMARAILLDEREADEVAARWMEAYDVVSPNAVAAAMRPWRLGHIYRSAITRFAVNADGAAQ
ncbi:DUF2336 domain-containing protein [Parasphingopyxis lamellibrachiae]|nr:DUF2336 domain-containing protein [Parasphingopyxis lamellibrachiae]